MATMNRLASPTPLARRSPAGAGRATFRGTVSGALFAALGAFAAPAHAAPPAAPVVSGLRVGKIGDSAVEIALQLAPSAYGGKCAGAFRGEVAFFDATPGMRVAGTLAAVPGGCELPATLPWSALTAEAVQGVRGDVLKVRYRGEWTDGRKAKKVDWSGTLPREAIQLAEPMKTTLQRHARATEIQLGGLGLSTTTVNAEVVVRSPLRFHLRVMEVRCQLEIDGKVVASGAKSNFIIFGQRPNPVTVPVVLDNRAVLAAAGSGLARGGRLAGRLVGVARLRFPAGDVEFPVEFPVQLALR